MLYLLWACRRDWTFRVLCLDPVVALLPMLHIFLFILEPCSKLSSIRLDAMLLITVYSTGIFASDQCDQTWLQFCTFITGPPNGPVLFCSLASVLIYRLTSSSVTLPAGGPAPGGRHCTAGQ